MLMGSIACSTSRSGIACVLALVGVFAARVSFAVEPPNPKDLTQGNWALQLDKSKFCNPSRAPQQSLRSIVNEGYGLISVHWTGVSADGKPMDIHYVYSYDGRKFPAGEYSPNRDLAKKEAITYHLINPHRVEFQHWSRDGKLTQSLVREVSDDGQTMTQTTKLTNRPGCTDTQVFQRQ
jgi:hypothetical protein